MHLHYLRMIPLRLLPLLAVLFLSASVFAQTLRGTVKTQAGEAIGFASITLLNTARGTVTDQAGNFSLTVAPGQYQVSIRAVGFATQIQRVSVTRNQPHDGPTVSLAVTLAGSTQALDEVVVTAEKTETDLQKTPAAVSVLSPKQLQEYRVWSISDLSALAPSLQTVEHGNSTSATFLNIRGVLGFTNEQAVAMYVDGVYQFEFFSAPLQFNNIASVEVLRGPQGTLFGRNAFGGVINITTRKPTNRTEGYAQLSIGNFGQQRYEASFSTPLVKDRLFLGVSGLFNRRSGIYTNTLTNSAFDRLQSVSGGLNLRYVASSRWNLALNLRAEADNDKGSYPWFGSDSAALASHYRVTIGTTNREQRSNLNASLAANYYGDKVNITSVSSYIHYQLGYPDRYEILGAQGNNVTNQRAFTQELRLSSATNQQSRLKWTLGSFLFLRNGLNESSQFQPVDQGNASLRITSNLTNLGIAFFGQTSYRLADRLTLTAGLRYDYESRQVAQKQDSLSGSGAVMNLVPFTSYRATFPAITPKVILDYQLSDNTLIYAQYARGFRAGGLNLFAPRPEDFPYKPEFSDNYEIGLKNTLWHKRLRLNLTGFYLQQRDQQVGIFDGPFFVTRNVGDMNNLGVELEATGLPAKGLQVEWNGSLSHARYSRLTALDVNFNNADFRGNRPVYTPGAASFLAFQYTYTFSKSASVFLRGEHKYTGTYYFDFNNAQKQPPFSLFNLRVGASYKNYELAGWVRNLTDRHYIAWGLGTYLLSNPRMLGLTLTSRF